LKSLWICVYFNSLSSFFYLLIIKLSFNLLENQHDTMISYPSSSNYLNSKVLFLSCKNFFFLNFLTTPHHLLTLGSCKIKHFRFAKVFCPLENNLVEYYQLVFDLSCLIEIHDEVLSDKSLIFNFCIIIHQNIIKLIFIFIFETLVLLIF
jgi:hypothetical protein